MGRNSTAAIVKAPVRIGISGKRSISETEQENVRTAIKQEITAILNKHKTNEFTGYSSMATGADTLFADVVTKEFGQSLHIVLPFNIEEYKNDFNDEDFNVLKKYLETASYEIVGNGPVSDKDARNKAYFEAGKKIIDESDEVIIIWDGLKPGGIGGTADIIGYVSESKGQQPEYIEVEPVTKDPVHNTIATEYNTANNNAITARNKYRRVWKTAIISGWLTVLCFAIKTAFHLHGPGAKLLTLAEWLFVIIAFILIFSAKKKDYHGNYLRERMKAETFRLFHYFYHADVDIKISSHSKEEKTGLATIAEKVNQNLKHPEQKSKWYTQYVIRSLIRDQCAYHENKIRSIGNKHHVFEQFNKFIGFFFFVNLTIHVVHLLTITDDTAEPDTFYKVSVFLNILLPATYAAIEGFIFFNEWALLRRYSDSAKQSLTEAEKLLPANLETCSFDECHKKQSETLRMISSIMLTDNRNWELLLEYKDNYHMIV